VGIFIATGDIAPDRENYGESFVDTCALLRSADIVFGQLETSFARHGVRAQQARHAVLARPDGARALADAGFTCISMAGNHVMDWGNEAFFETKRNLEDAGITVVGAGANIRDAGRPARFAMPDGTRVAVLAYCSILPMSYWADERRPGCAPMRAFTVYEQIEHDQPGTPARIHTYPHREDLALMEEDIRSAKRESDIVIVSQHWGIHFVRATIAQYQRDVARAAIAAGADAIIGTHPHLLKGCEVIDGKPVFYSLCNFATDLRMDRAHAESKSFREIQALAEEWVPDFDSLYNFPKASRLSMIVRLEISGGKVLHSGFLPLYIGSDAVPHLLKPEDSRYGEVVDYIESVSREAGLDARFAIGSDMVAVLP